MCGREGLLGQRRCRVCNGNLLVDELITVPRERWQRTEEVTWVPPSRRPRPTHCRHCARAFDEAVIHAGSGLCRRCRSAQRRGKRKALRLAESGTS
jgi:hypothetical protein